MKRRGLALTPTQYVEVNSIPEPNTGCWLWLKSLDSCGYGKARWNQGDGSKYERAHRYSFRAFIGAIPEGLFVLHACDQRSCVCPTHLRAGTMQDNADDRERRKRGRPMRGEAHGQARLTAMQVIRIRAEFAAGGVTIKELAKKLGLAPQTVGHIVRRYSWRSLS